MTSQERRRIAIAGTILISLLAFEMLFILATGRFIQP
jgi:hypothetical protein